MNIRHMYIRWWRKNKYKKVQAGISKLNKLADDIEAAIPEEINLTSLLCIIINVVISIYVVKTMSTVSEGLMSVFRFRPTRRRSHLFFWH